MATKKQRSVIARIGGLSLRAQQDPLNYTRAAREAAYHRFEIEVDPQGELSADERGKRANAARRAYMQRLALCLTSVLCETRCYVSEIRPHKPVSVHKFLIRDILWISLANRNGVSRLAEWKVRNRPRKMTDHDFGAL